MSEEQTKREWHLDKSVSGGHILTTLALGVTLVAGWVQVKEDSARSATKVEMLQSDVTDLKAAYITQNELHRAESRHMRQEFQAMRSELMLELRDLRKMINGIANPGK